MKGRWLGLQQDADRPELRGKGGSNRNTVVIRQGLVHSSPTLILGNRSEKSPRSLQGVTGPLDFDRLSLIWLLWPLAERYDSVSLQFP